MQTNHNHSIRICNHEFRIKVADLYKNKFIRPMGGDLAPNFGGTKKIFRGPISGKMFIFRVKMSILRVKISDDLFLVIDLVLWIFPFFSHIFRIFTMLNVVYDHFLTRKTPFSTLFILSRTSDNTTSQNIGGDQCMGRLPHLKFWGTIPPRSPPLHTCTFCLLVAATENCAIEN